MIKTSDTSAAFLALLIGRIIDGDNLDDALDRTSQVLASHPGGEETLAAIRLCRTPASDST